jgi:hypothetical protein
VRSLAYAVAMAELLGGAVVIPKTKPTNKVASVSAIGLDPDPTAVGLFNVSRLLFGLPMAFGTEDGVRASLQSRKQCRFMKLYEHLKDGHRWKEFGHEPRAPALVALVKARNCTAIDLEGGQQTLPPFSVPICSWFQRDLNLQLLYRHLVPQSWIQQAVAARMERVRWAQPSVGMHFRNQAQGSKNLSVCMQWASYHLEHANYSSIESNIMANVTCTMDPRAIAAAWRLYALPHTFETMPGKWLLATDRADCVKAFANDVRIFNKKVCPARWRLKEGHEATWLNTSSILLPPDTNHTSFSRYAEAIPEMWALSQTDFFFGTLKSSLSDLVCGWRAARGEAFVTASNTCWAYHLNNILPGPNAMSACTL